MEKYIVGLLTLISLLANGQYKAEEFEAALLEAKYGASAFVDVLHQTNQMK